MATGAPLLHLSLSVFLSLSHARTSRGDVSDKSELHITQASHTPLQHVCYSPQELITEMQQLPEPTHDAFMEHLIPQACPPTTG